MDVIGSVKSVSGTQPETVIGIYIKADDCFMERGLVDESECFLFPRLRDSKYQRAFIVPGQPWNDVGGHLPQRHVQDRERNQPTNYHPKGIRYLQQ